MRTKSMLSNTVLVILIVFSVTGCSTKLPEVKRFQNLNNKECVSGIFYCFPKNLVHAKVNIKVNKQKMSSLFKSAVLRDKEGVLEVGTDISQSNENYIIIDGKKYSDKVDVRKEAILAYLKKAVRINETEIITESKTLSAEVDMLSPEFYTKTVQDPDNIFYIAVDSGSSMETTNLTLNLNENGFLSLANTDTSDKTLDTIITGTTEVLELVSSFIPLTGDAHAEEKTSQKIEEAKKNMEDIVNTKDANEIIKCVNSITANRQSKYNINLTLENLQSSEVYSTAIEACDASISENIKMLTGKKSTEIVSLIVEYDPKDFMTDGVITILEEKIVDDDSPTLKLDVSELVKKGKKIKIKGKDFTPITWKKTNTNDSKNTVIDYDLKMTVNKDQFARKVPSVNSGKNSEGSYFYRIPANMDIKMVKMVDKVKKGQSTSTSLTISQLGSTRRLPNKFKGKYSKLDVTFDPNTARLTTLKVATQANEWPTHISNVSESMKTTVETYQGKALKELQNKISFLSAQKQLKQLTEELSQ